MFKIRGKKELIGLILGSVCFIPSFIIAMMVGTITNNILGIIILIITQLLWLTSITLASWSLEMENRRLKEELKKENESYEN